MNVSGPSDARERRKPSPLDSLYTSARSPSGDHLIPCSPTPARSYSQDPSWLAGGWASSSNEPSPHAHGDNVATWEILTHVSRSPSPRHRFVSETSSATPKAQSPCTTYHHLNANQVDPSRRPPSVRSLQPSVSQRSFNHQRAAGSAPYRKHQGPLARPHSPAPEQCIIDLPSTPITVVPEHSGVSFLVEVALPRDNDPNQPGESTIEARRFYPMSVNGVLRYECRKTRCPSDTDYTIGAMSYQYPETPNNVPEGWMAYRHPEGALYFVHTESRTFAEVDICDEDIYADIESFRTFLLSELKTEIENQDHTELNIDEIELVLEPKLDDDGLMCCYYFVNPSARVLFWLDEWEGYEVFKDCRGELSLSHKGLGIQAHYWCVTRSHWDLYPNFCKVTQALKDEVVNKILHATCDHLTSNKSSCPSNPEDLKKYLYLIERIDPEKKEGSQNSAIIIGRIMHIFYNNYFLNYHGEECARLNFDQSIHGWVYHPSWFMMVVALFSFMVPIKNVHLLHNTFVDKIASKETWKMFVTHLSSQLQATCVLAAVFLIANAAFLSGQPGTGTSQFFIYMSLATSMASIILALVLMGNSLTKASNTPFEAAKFLEKLWHEKYGLETLAIVYSLPQVFLVWSILFFSAIVAVQWCYYGDLWLRVVARAVMFVIAVLVAWCIRTTQDEWDHW